jgi:hypothetical protein
MNREIEEAKKLNNEQMEKELKNTRDTHNNEIASRKYNINFYYIIFS